MQKGEVKAILVMDFDGVIVDSTDEGLFTGFCAYKSLNPKTRLFGKNLSPDNFKIRMKKYKVQYKKYRHYRTYLRNALDYYYIMYFIDKRIPIKNSSDFNEKSKKVPVDKKRFVRGFYNIRSKLMRENFSKWVKLEPLYPHMKRFLSRQGAFYISTSNRRSTVLKTFRHFGIKINPKQILDNKLGLDKKVHIERIKRKENVDYSDIFFIDDQLSHFLNLRHLGVNCILAGWGYVNEEQRRKARRMGIKIANTGSFVKIISRK